MKASPITVATPDGSHRAAHAPASGIAGAFEALLHTAAGPGSPSPHPALEPRRSSTASANAGTREQVAVDTLESPPGEKPPVRDSTPTPRGRSTAHGPPATSASAQVATPATPHELTFARPAFGTTHQPNVANAGPANERPALPQPLALDRSSPHTATTTPAPGGERARKVDRATRPFEATPAATLLAPANHAPAPVPSNVPAPHLAAAPLTTPGRSAPEVKSRQVLPPEEKVVSASRRSTDDERSPSAQPPPAPTHLPVHHIGTGSPELKAPKAAPKTGGVEASPRAAAKATTAPGLVDRLGTFEHVATRAKARHDSQQRLAGTNAPPTERQAAKASESDERRDREALARGATSASPAALPTPQPSPTFELSAPAVPVATAPSIPAALEAFLPQLQDDPSLRIALMPNTARVSLDTPDGGRVSLQLKVKDGVTEVRASGPAAAALELRTNELRVALAHEGLALGHFDLTQSNSQHRQAERPEPPEPTSGARRTTPSPSSTGAVSHDGRLHVKA